jgi:(heptosyl)LPS beta-1,4-glucosyltransferase
MRSSNSITAVIITRNEELMLPVCLETVAWCDQILVIDADSTDRTVQIAENFGAKVISSKIYGFDRWRNEALKRVTTDWLFYVDADERVSPTLAKEIAVQIETQDVAAFKMKRSNICYAKEFKHGGWQEDYVTRLFKKDALKKWVGEVHESPIYTGKEILLQSPLIHLTHRNTSDGLIKSANWTKIEAKLLANALDKKVNFATFLRKGVMEFIRRAFFKKGYKDGMEGMIEALVQGINKILVYIQVWEFQQKPSLISQYQRQDQIIKNLWTKERSK